MHLPPGGFCMLVKLRHFAMQLRQQEIQKKHRGGLGVDQRY